MLEENQARRRVVGILGQAGWRAGAPGAHHTLTKRRQSRLVAVH